MRGGRMTWVIDTNPATPAIDGLRQGESFMDPAGGVSFSVQALGPTGASVKVDVPAGMGGAVCLDGSAFAPPGVESCGNAQPTGPVTPMSVDAGAASAGDAGRAGSGGSGTNRGSGGNGGPSDAGGTGGASGRAGAPGADEPRGGEPSKNPTGAPEPTPEPISAASCSCRVGDGARSASAVPGGIALLFLTLAGAHSRRRRTRR
jgi:MYXO-CTERM domain-containing protein